MARFVARQLLSPLLVGRDEALALAERRIEEAVAGRGATLLVAGEPGIGKTRLLQALLRKADRAGMRVARSDLSAHDHEVPFASIADLARSMRVDEAFGSSGTTLLEHLDNPALETIGTRRRLVHAVADDLLTTADRPTVFAFDDLQWADELSLEVIAEVARRGRDRPLLLLAGYRNEGRLQTAGLREWRSTLVSQRLAEEVRLSPLDRDQTALVVTLILGGDLPAPRGVVDAVHERTDGIPLHIEELLGALDDEARTSDKAIREAQVPVTIEDAVLARLSRLTAEAREVARAGAVFGRSFVPDVVAGCLDRPVTSLERPLADLVEHAFVEPVHAQPHATYDFRHALLRDAVYGTVPPIERRRLHARAAEFVSLMDGPSTIHASVHFERAGLRSQAFRAAVSGARAAAALTSSRESFELYSRAVANQPDDMAASEAADLQAAFSAAASAVDEPLIAEQAARAAAAGFELAGRVEDAAMVLLLVESYAARQLRPRAERLAILDRCDEMLAGCPTSVARTTVEFESAVSRFMDGIDAGVASDSALARQSVQRLARDLQTEASSVDAAFVEAAWAQWSGEADDGLEALLRVGHQARQAGMDTTALVAFRRVASGGIAAMDYAVANRGVAEGRRFASEIEQSYCGRMLAASAANIAWAAGRWDDAEREAGSALAERGSRRAMAACDDVLGLVALGRGDLARARRLLEESMAIGSGAGEVPTRLTAAWGLAELDLLAGDPGAAYARCESALDEALATEERALLVPYVVSGVRAALGARRADLAEGWLVRLRQALDGWETVARPAIDHADGLLRMSAGFLVQGRIALEAAEAGWRARGRTWEASWARLDIAGCLLRANREAEALALLEPALFDARALGSRPLEARAAELLEIARRRGAEEEPWRPLTAREFEVARLVADGLTNGAIGEQLGLSPRTVGAHVEHILAKLGFTRRAEIAAWVAAMAVTAGGVAG